MSIMLRSLDIVQVLQEERDCKAHGENCAPVVSIECDAGLIYPQARDAMLYLDSSGVAEDNQ